MIFKKTLLKALAVTTVVGAVMAMGSVVVNAAPTMWVYNDSGATTEDLKLPEVFGTITTSSKAAISGESNRSGAFKEGIFADGKKEVNGKSGLDISTQTVDSGQLIQIAPKEDGRYEFFAIRVSGGGSSEFRVYEYANGASGSKSVIASNATVGYNDTDVLPVVADLKQGKTYAFYCNSSSGGALFAIRFTPAAEVTYTPNGSEPTVSENKVYGGDVTNLTNGTTVSESATSKGAEDGDHIRIGKDAVTGNGGTGDGTSPAQWGYISFTASGNFAVSVDMKSSGSERTLYIGTSPDNGTTFTNLKESAPIASGTVVFEISDGADTTYYIYGKDKNNIDIYKTDLITGDYVNTSSPSVTLSDPTSTGDGKIQVVAKFENFSKDMFEIQSINLKAGVGTSSQETAVWYDNEIKTLKDNGDDTVEFTAQLSDASTETVSFQVVAKYNGIDARNISVQNAEAVSNVVTYKPAA